MLHANFDKLNPKIVSIQKSNSNILKISKYMI